jgi:hypothetical protein
MALASAAGAVPAIKRNVETGAIGSVGHQLVGPRLDEARHTILEIERNAVHHVLLPPDLPFQMW